MIRAFLLRLLAAHDRFLRAVPVARSIASHSASKAFSYLRSLNSPSRLARVIAARFMLWIAPFEVSTMVTFSCVTRSSWAIPMLTSLVPWACSLASFQMPYISSEKWAT